MELVRIYQCLCDRTRLRILNLLSAGPLCVCHIHTVLGESQVKVSKHLGYLKARRLVDVRQQANWRVYRIAQAPSRALQANLACLQDCAQEDKIFRRDLEKLARLRPSLDETGLGCCAEPSSRKKTRLKSSAISPDL